MITIDFETRSLADLKKTGVWSYSEHATTEVICVCYGIDSEPVQEWWPRGAGGVPGRKGSHPELPADVMPNDLAKAIRSGHLVEAHGVPFEMAIWINVLAKRYGWELPGDDYWRCIMAVARYYGLPPALDNVSRALGYETKDPEGARLITKYSKLHLKTAKTDIPDADFYKFVDYCLHDVRMEQSISDHLGDLPEREIPIFLLDLKVNRRGIHLDEEGIAAAAAVVEQRSEELTQEFQGITGLGPGQRDAVMRWCAEQGVELENMQAEYLGDLLMGELGMSLRSDLAEPLKQGPVRRALEIRLAINKASTKKLDAMARQRAEDGTAKFQTNYHGAVTGRNTGTGFQPLNLNKGFQDMDVPPEQLVRDIMHRDPALLDAIYGDAMDAVAKASRHWIVAGEGKKIISGDFSSVEAVILACLAGETWKVEMFERGEPVYERTADKIFKLPLGTVTKKTHPKERSVGKILELACGYQGWLGAWLNFDKSGDHTDEEIKGYMGGWREDHPAIVSFWRDLENAAIEAVRNPKGEVQLYRSPISFETVDEWLSMVLPNGKRLWYFDPQLRAAMPPWHKPKENEECAGGLCKCRARTQVTYMAQKEGQWRRQYSYGGKWAENATQAVSREILEVAKPAVEAAGYEIVLSIYDEPVCEVPLNFGSPEELAKIMSEARESWFADWPIRATAWQGARFKK